MLERLAEERFLGDGLGAGAEGRELQLLERLRPPIGHQLLRIRTRSRACRRARPPRRSGRWGRRCSAAACCAPACRAAAGTAARSRPGQPIGEASAHAASARECSARLRAHSVSSIGSRRGAGAQGRARPVGHINIRAIRSLGALLVGDEAAIPRPVAAIAAPRPAGGCLGVGGRCWPIIGASDAKAHAIWNERIEGTPILRAAGRPPH